MLGFRAIDTAAPFLQNITILIRTNFIMNSQSFRLATLSLMTLALMACGGSKSVSPPSTESEEAVDNALLVTLGDALFTDKTLSVNNIVSCQSCHTSAGVAFSDSPNRLSAGVMSNITVRNSPALSYVSFIPALTQVDMAWIGGLFHDGRADSLAEQIEGPLLGAREMGNSTKADVIAKLCASSSPSKAEFTAAYGSDSLSAACAATPQQADIDTTFARIGRALAALQSSEDFQPFSSKYDAYLNGKASLSKQEIQGLSAFVRADKGNCAACHVINRDNPAKQPLFTDFTYDNIGLPSVAGDVIDPGLFATAKVNADASLQGKFRVPTLRNVEVTAPYMHNGVFADLKTAVEFYSSRDTDPRWAAMGATDYPETVNKTELGNLKLSAGEIDAIVAFLKTLTDNYTAP